MRLPKGKTNSYEEMMEGFASGLIQFGVPGAKRIQGTTSPYELFKSLAPEVRKDVDHLRNAKN